MNGLRFGLARLLRNETVLQTLSAPLAEVMAQLHDQSIALVGNARSLAQGKHGAEIDAADLVIRINRAPMPSPASHGTRTDILGLATRIPQADLDRLRPGRLFWMSHKRKRLPYKVATSAGFYMPPLDAFHQLSAQLGAPPTTGLMLINLLSQSRARSIGLYGFDFFASLSLSGHRTAQQVPHDFGGERGFVTALAARDPRFRLVPPAENPLSPQGPLR